MLSTNSQVFSLIPMFDQTDLCFLFFICKIPLHQYCSDGLLYYCFLQPTKTSELGTVNNVLEVKKSDFEVFEALAFDSTTNVSKGRMICYLWRSRWSPEVIHQLISMNN